MDGKNLTVKKTEEQGELHLLYAEVYIPDIPDAHNDFMTADEIRKMAHEFMISKRTDQVDVQHDNKLYGCHIVESFIAEEYDQVFIPGSWVVVIWVPNDELWQRIKDGELNGLSMEVYAKKKVVDGLVEFPLIVSGMTMEVDGHSHNYEVYFDEDGKFVGGKTDEVDGHFHTISSGTITEDAGEDPHHHKFAMLDKIVEL